MSKILFITPLQEYSLGVRFLAAYLQQNGHSTHTINFKETSYKIFDDIVEEHHGYQSCVHGIIWRCGVDVAVITKKELSLLKDCIAEHKPDIIGLSAFSAHAILLPQLMPTLLSFAHTTLLVAGGCGPSLAPEVFLNAGFDVVVKGDGEEALLELANACPPPSQPWEGHNILNTVWRTEQGYKHNKMRAMSRNLSSYPSPLMGDLYSSYIKDDEIFKNYDFQKNHRTYMTLLGRGCVGKCTYCLGAQWIKWYKEDSGCPVVSRRNRSLESIFSELKSLDKKDYDYLELADELISMSTDNLKIFLTWYKKEINKPFGCYFPYEQIIKNPEIAQLAVEAGWKATGIGIQTGSENFAKKYYNRNNHNKHYIDYAKILLDNDIYIQLQFITGNCYETDEDFRKTIDIIKQLPFSLATPEMTHLACIRLKAEPTTPLLDICPKLVTEPMPVKEWFRRSMLMNLARVVPENVWEALYTEKCYYEDPLALRKIYFSELSKLQVLYYNDLAEKWQGKRVAFYGIDDVILANFIFFKRFHPECMLMDKKFIKNKRKLFKLPIRSLEEFLPSNKDIYIICFSQFHATTLKRNIIQMGLPKSQVEACSHIFTSFE